MTNVTRLGKCLKSWTRPGHAKSLPRSTRPLPLSELDIDIVEAILDHLQEEGFNAFTRLIHPAAIGSQRFIVIAGKWNEPLLGVSLIGSEIELCSLHPTPDCPQGFPHDFLGFFELTDHTFVDDLIAGIESWGNSHGYPDKSMRVLNHDDQSGPGKTAEAPVPQ